MGCLSAPTPRPRARLGFGGRSRSLQAGELLTGALKAGQALQDFIGEAQVVGAEVGPVVEDRGRALGDSA